MSIINVFATILRQGGGKSVRHISDEVRQVGSRHYTQMSYSAGHELGEHESSGWFTHLARRIKHRLGFGERRLKMITTNDLDRGTLKLSKTGKRKLSLAGLINRKRKKLDEGEGFFVPPGDLLGRFEDDD